MMALTRPMRPEDEKTDAADRIPYLQGNPNVNTPFKVNAGLGDPDFSACNGAVGLCLVMGSCEL